jgi:hypothetical protein
MCRIEAVIPVTSGFQDIFSSWVAVGFKCNFISVLSWIVFDCNV